MDRVIKGLEGIYRCISPVNHACGDCPYQDNHVECRRRALSDAIALLKEQEHKDRMYHALEDDWKRLNELLKEQEAVEPEVDYICGNMVNVCGKCKSNLIARVKFCPWCGQAVKW